MRRPDPPPRPAGSGDPPPPAADGYLAGHNRLPTDLRRFGIPVVTEEQEPGDETEGRTADPQRADPRPFTTQTSASLIPAFWGAACAGAYVVRGHPGTSATGDPLPETRKSGAPRARRALHDRPTTLPCWETEPASDLVQGAEREAEGQR